MAGTTGRVDRISRAGAPRSCAMRILFTTATGTEVCELESAADLEACCEKVRTAPGDTSSTRHANWRAHRGNNIPWSQLKPYEKKHITWGQAGKVAGITRGGEWQPPVVPNRTQADLRLRKKLVFFDNSGNGHFALRYPVLH